jgi:hypothetical protein
MALKITTEFEAHFKLSEKQIYAQMQDPLKSKRIINAQTLVRLAEQSSIDVFADREAHTSSAFKKHKKLLIQQIHNYIEEIFFYAMLGILLSSVLIVLVHVLFTVGVFMSGAFMVRAFNVQQFLTKVIMDDIDK